MYVHCNRASKQLTLSRKLHNSTITTAIAIVIVLVIVIVMVIAIVVMARHLQLLKALYCQHAQSKCCIHVNSCTTMLCFYTPH
jgi:hypothetical protein